MINAIIADAIERLGVGHHAKPSCRHILPESQGIRIIDTAREKLFISTQVRISIAQLCKWAKNKWKDFHTSETRERISQVECCESKSVWWISGQSKLFSNFYLDFNLTGNSNTNTISPGLMEGTRSRGKKKEEIEQNEHRENEHYLHALWYNLNFWVSIETLCGGEFWLRKK